MDDDIGYQHKLFVDVLQMTPNEISGRKVVTEDMGGKIVLYLPASRKFGGGRESKKVLINRIIVFDKLFFEGLGLWQCEGGKSKGIYFCNLNSEVIYHFLIFVKRKLGLSRSEFKITICTPNSNELEKTKEKWSKLLGIPVYNFTVASVDPRINKDNAQVYFNSILLVELLKNMHEKLKPVIKSNVKFAAAYLRGIFAGEGCVLLKKSRVYFTLISPSKTRVWSSSINNALIFSKSHMVNIIRSLKFPVQGYRNFKRFKELGIHTLHPEKREKFERGFANYKRINVLDGEEARSLILQRLSSGPKRYDDLAVALGKARTTIQAYHISLLEKQGLIKRAGKRGQAWLWALAEPTPVTLPNSPDRIAAAART